MWIRGGQGVCKGSSAFQPVVLFLKYNNGISACGFLFQLVIAFKAVGISQN